MKTEKLVFLIFVCFGLLFGCNNDEMPGDDLAGINLKKASMPAVFMVEPSGGDDTPAFMQAFDDAKAAGPGSVVQLAEGEYHLGFIEIRDFVGSFMGAGKDKTIITAMNHMDGQSVLDKNLMPDLVKFVGGDVVLRNITLQTPEGKVTDTGTPAGNIRSLVALTAGNASYELNNEDRSIKAVIDQVRFRGHELEGGPGYTKGHNCYMGLRSGYDCRTGSDVPRAKIDVKVTNSEFETFVYALTLEGTKNGRLIVGEKNKGNTFNDNDQSGGFWESRHMEIRVEGNTYNVIPFGYGVDMDDAPWYGILKKEPETAQTLFCAQDNVFNLNHSEYALFLRNRWSYYDPEGVPVAYQIKNNKFNMTDGYEWAILSYFTHGAVIRNNQFRGHGDLALYLVNYSENGLVLGNNFSTCTWGSGVAYLTASTKNWTFVGGDFTDKVMDLGVNNVFTGMNVSTADEPLGRSIADKLPPMNHLMH